MWLRGTNVLDNKLYSERNYNKFGQLLRCLDECVTGDAAQ